MLEVQGMCMYWVSGWGHRKQKTRYTLNPLSLTGPLSHKILTPDLVPQAVEAVIAHLELYGLNTLLRIPNFV